MGKLSELYEQRAALSGKLTALRSSFDSADEPTDEQVAQISDLRGQVDSVTAQIHKIEATRKQLEDMQASLDATAPPTRLGAGNPDLGNPFNPLAIPRTTASMIERQAKGRMSGAGLEVYKGDSYLATIGAQFIGALRGDQSCKDAVQATYHEFEATQNTQQNSLGGFLVPDDLVPTLIELREQYGSIRRNATVMNVNAPSGSIPRLTSTPDAAFTGEPRDNDIPTQDLTFDRITYNVKPLSVATPATLEMLDDSLINISALVFKHAQEKFAKKEDQCGFLGDGTSLYGGILGILPILDLAAHAGSVFVTTGETSLAAVTNGSLANATGFVPDYVGTNAKWFVSKRVNGGVFDRLKLAAGGNTVQNVEGRTIRQYNGYDIEISQILPATPTTGQQVGLFGDMAMAAHMFVKSGIIMASSEHVNFLKREVVYLTTQRFDFNFHERGTATEAGPLIAIELA